VSWRALIRSLDESRDVKRAVYRGHRIAGIALFAGALYTLDRLWFAYEPGALARVLKSWGSGDLQAIFAQSLWFFLFGGNVAALAAALLVVFRPSLLKGLERWADRIYGTRNTS